MNQKYKLFKRKLYEGKTSGTTGTPLSILKTIEAVQFKWAVWWRHRAKFGCKLGDKYVMFGARVLFYVNKSKPPYWRNDWVGNRIYITRFSLTNDKMKDIVNYIDSQKPIFFTGYPSAMFVLTNYIRENNLRFKYPPKYIISASESLTSSFEKTLSSAPVTNQYGSAEVCGNSSRCEYGNYHSDFEFGYPEFIDIPACLDKRYKKNEIYSIYKSNNAVYQVRF